jgi:prepilin-type N-terminal cleavage/methylation domain-containing protein
MNKRAAASSRSRRFACGFNMIELLVVLVVLVAVAAFLWPRYMGSKSKETGRYTGPVTQARDTVCRSNLSQIRASIQAMSAADPDGKAPASLAELGLPDSMLRCPTGNEPYRYDPAAGRVQCPHPGHEGY